MNTLSGSDYTVCPVCGAACTFATLGVYNLDNEVLAYNCERAGLYSDPTEVVGHVRRFQPVRILSVPPRSIPVASPPKKDPPPMPNTAISLPVDTHERISTISPPVPYAADFIDGAGSSTPRRSETAPLATENAPPSPPLFMGDPCGKCGHLRGMHADQQTYPAPGSVGCGAYRCRCGRFGDPALASALASKNARVAAAWKRLAEATGLGPDELADLSLLEAAALVAETRTQRGLHTRLAAGSPAVAGEFYVPCGKCQAPVDVRGPVAHVDCERK